MQRERLSTEQPWPLISETNYCCHLLSDRSRNGLHPAAASLKIPAEIPAWHKFCHTEHFGGFCGVGRGQAGMLWDGTWGLQDRAVAGGSLWQVLSELLKCCVLFRALPGECHCKLCCFHVDQKTVKLWRGENRALSANCTSGKCLSNHLVFQYHPRLTAVLKIYSSTALNVVFCLFSVVLLFCLGALVSAFKSYQCPMNYNFTL